VSPVRIPLKPPEACQQQTKAMNPNVFCTTNPHRSFAVTWIRIHNAPPSTCPIRDRDSIDVANRALWRDFAFWGPNWFVGTSGLLLDFGPKSPARDCASSAVSTCNFQLLSSWRESPRQAASLALSLGCHSIPAEPRAVISATMRVMLATIRVRLCGSDLFVALQHGWLRMAGVLTAHVVGTSSSPIDGHTHPTGQQESPAQLYMDLCRTYAVLLG
jgi:hypothetical protein